MVVNNVSEHLTYIGFSEYEARAYVALLERNPVTAYELARASGVPTSKVYGVLDKLAAKGMVSATGEARKRYIPSEPLEYLEDFSKKVEGTLGILKKELSSIGRNAPDSHIWNTRGYGHLMGKARRMVDEAERAVLLSIWPEEIRRLLGPLKKAEERGVGVSVVLFGAVLPGPGAVFHHPVEHTLQKEKGGRGIVVVSDSAEALTGSVLPGGRAEGAWSANAGFVALAEEYIQHDVYVMKILRRYDRELKRVFGRDYEKLRDVFSDREEDRA